MWFSGKESTCQYRRLRRYGFDPWVGEISWRRKWQPPPVFLPGKSFGQRSLASYCPWGHKDTTEWYTHTYTHTRTHTHENKPKFFQKKCQILIQLFYIQCSCKGLCRWNWASTRKRASLLFPTIFHITASGAFPLN